MIGTPGKSIFSIPIIDIFYTPNIGSLAPSLVCTEMISVHHQQRTFILKRNRVIMTCAKNVENAFLKNEITYAVTFNANQSHLSYELEN